MSLIDRRDQRAAENALEERLAELRATMESTGDGVLVTDMNGRVRNYNHRFVELWRIPESVLRADAAEVLPAYMESCVRDAASYALRLSYIWEHPALEITDSVELENGQLLERVTLPQYGGAGVQGRVFSFRDVTQREAARTQLQLASKVFESSLDGIFVTDAAFNIVQANPQSAVLLECEPQGLIGMAAQAIFATSNASGFFGPIADDLQRHDLWAGQLKLVRGAQTRSLEVSWVALRDSLGEVQQSIVFFRDNTEHVEAQKRIETLAYTDALTGLPNRLLLSQRVDFALRLANRQHSTFALMFVDLDRFKNINDSMGHAFGDRVLQEVALRIRSCLRDVDTLSRQGGDEFVCFLQEADAYGAEIAARRILQAVTQPIVIDTMTFSIGCSIGIAMYPADGKTLDELVKCADTAMYRVKDRGRGDFRFYQPQMNVDLLSRVKIDHAMRIALEQGYFMLHYQPKISLSDGSLVGAEALIRWKDPGLGTMSPASFIPLAEESGFIIPLGNWVLAEAVRQATIWQREGSPVQVSVNVSALQFQQPDFVERVADSLSSTGLLPALLELELTESILVKDANEALHRLQALANLGISLAIDDFGTGYSSLAYLKKFPISKLKIDRAFITGLPEDESDRAIVSATIGMARALKLQVVAEGVETEAQREYLRGLQCEAYQGFLCSPGVAADAFEAFLKVPR